MRSSWKLIIYASGIFISYAVFGIFQEKIFRSKYGDHDERFNYTFSLMLIQCAMNALMAVVLLKTVWKQGHDATSTHYHFFASIFYLGAMLSSFIALKYVNYPTQVVAKSCKPIPVMILGVLLARKRYPLLKYIFVTLIVVGVALFMYKDNHDKGSADESSMFGNLLLMLSLTGDGLLGSVQDRMRQNFATKSLHMMWKTNAFSLIYITLGLLYTGELSAFFAFVHKYPQLYGEIALFATCSAFGQIFIYSMVAEFGPLPCSIVTTTRKFFTVIASIVIFGNALSNRQWIGTVFVFTGLFLDAVYGKTPHVSKQA